MKDKEKSGLIPNPLNPRSGEEIHYDARTELRQRFATKVPGRPNPIFRTAHFSKLALGVKFRYNGGHKTIWVKIGDNLIAEWDPGQVETGWVGQQVCCFNDPFKDEEVIICE